MKFSLKQATPIKKPKTARLDVLLETNGFIVGKRRIKEP